MIKLTDTLGSGVAQESVSKPMSVPPAAPHCVEGGFVVSVEEGLCILGCTKGTYGWQKSDLASESDLRLLIWNEDHSKRSQLKVFYHRKEWLNFIHEKEPFPFLTIMISRRWIECHESTEDAACPDVLGQALFRFIPLQSGLPFGMEMLNDLLQAGVSPFQRNLKIKKWVFVVMDAFYSRIRAVMNGEGVVGGEGHRLERIAAELIADFQEVPPTVEALARSAAMSSTKFKSLFKQLYGMAVYEYYQLHRMRFAKDLLVSGQYTVQEVGRRIGYQNMSHFATAFKKVHGQLPGQLLGLK